MLRFLRTNRSIVSGGGERESGETLRLMSFLRYIPWGCFPKDFKGVAPEIRQSKHESRLPRRVRTRSLGHERDPRLGWLILAPGQHGFASRERNTGRVVCVHASAPPSLPVSIPTINLPVATRFCTIYRCFTPIYQWKSLPNRLNFGRNNYEESNQFCKICRNSFEDRKVY